MLTLFEHEAIPFNWTERDCALLERLRVAIGLEVLRATFRGGNKVILATQHVGVVRLGNRTVQVLPKLYRGGDTCEVQVRAKEATANLLRMLSYAGELPLREYALAPLLKQTDDWFEILTRLFASHMREEWKQRACRTYQTLEEELPVLKGKWRIADQFRQPARQHIFSISFDEFTADNRLNRIFRFVVERLWQLTRESHNRQLLGELRQWMDEVTLLPRVTVEDANPSQLTRLNDYYRPLLNLAKLFLDGGALQLAAGDLSTFAFMFDMNVLFEGFIAGFIRRYCSEVLPKELFECEYLPQSRGIGFHLARRDQEAVFQTRPDIAFRDSAKHFPLLVDTKYKRLEKADQRLGVSPADFHQMYAYSHRYDCPRVILLYPQMVGMHEPLKACFVVEKTARLIEAATVNLRVDMGSKLGRQKLVEELRTVFRGGV